MSEKIRVGTYFYPNEPSCPVRTERAGGKQVESEPYLARWARPLFPGHDQPRSYCLGNAEWTDWDDSEAKTAKRHVELAQEAGFDFFIVDSYLGIRNGMRVQESSGFLSQLSDMEPQYLGQLHFGMMCCFRAPRTIMAIKPGDTERNRGFDASIETARFIVDQGVSNYWKHPNYLMVNGQPYVSFFLPGTGATDEQSETFRRFFEELKQYSLSHYQIEPYVVGVVSHKSPVADAPALERMGVNAITGYSNILNFPQTDPVVAHAPLIDARVLEWERIGEMLGVPVQPTAQIGLDTSPRCEYTDEEGKPFLPTQQEQLRPFIGKYPHSSIVTGSTAETYGNMLVKLSDVVRKSKARGEEKIITINAWNEMSEGSCMLPRVRDNELDWSYITMSRTLLSALAQQEK